MARRFKKPLLILLLLAALCTTILHFVAQSTWVETAVRDRIVQELQKRYPVRVFVGEVSVSLWGPAVEVRDLAIFPESQSGDEPPAPLRFGRIAVNPALLATLRGGVALDAVEIAGFALRVPEEGEGPSLGQMFSPKGGSVSGAAPPSIRIDSLAIRRSSISYGRKVMAMDDVSFGLTLALEMDAAGGYGGTARLDRLTTETERLIFRELDVQVDFEGASAHSPRLTVSLRSPALKARLNGEISAWDGPVYAFDVQAEGDFTGFRKEDVLSTVESAPFTTAGRLEGTGKDFTYRGQVTSPKVQALGLSFEGIQATVEAVRDRVQVEDSRMTLRGGDLRATGQVAIADEVPNRLHVLAQGVDLSGFHPAMEGSADADVTVAWQGHAWESMSGRGTARYWTAVQLGHWFTWYPQLWRMSGEGKIEIRTRRVAFSQGKMAEGPLRGSVEGSWDFDNHWTLSFDGESPQGQNLLTAALEHWAEDLPTQLRSGVAISDPIGLQTAVSGTGSEFSLSGSVRGSSLSLNERPWGQWAADFRWAEDRFYVDPLTLDQEALSAAARFSIPTDDPAIEDWSVHLRAALLDLDHVRELIEIPVQASGPLSGSADLHHEADGWHGQASLSLAPASLEGQRFDSIAASGSIQPQSIQVESLKASLGEGRLTASGNVDLRDRRATLKASGAGIDLALLETGGQSLPVQGVVDSIETGATVQWGGDVPSASIDKFIAKASELSVAGFSFTDVDLSAPGSDKQVDLTLSAGVAGTRLTTKGTLGLRSPFPARVALKAEKLPIRPFLEVFMSEPPEGMEGLFSGSISAQGPLTDFGKLTASAELTTLEASTGGYRVRNTDVIRADYSGGRLEVKPFRLVELADSQRRGTTELEVSGDVNFIAPRSVNFRVEGGTNLRILNDFIPAGVLSGEVALNVAISGALEDPRIVGSARLERGFVVSPYFPVTLFDARGEFQFSPNLVSIDRFSSRTVYGEMRATGGIFLSGWRLDAWKINVFGTGLQAEYPRGLRSVVDVSLEILKSDDSELIAGQVDVRSAEYQRLISLTELITDYLDFRQGGEVAAEQSDVDLDLRVRGYRAISIENNLADLRASADLTIRGTLNEPIVLGSLNIDEGSLSLEDNDYEIVRGSVNFNNPRRTTPNLNFEAVTNVRDYEVTLQMRGTPDRLRFDFHADPPLPTPDIVSLLAVGQTQEEVFGTAAARTSAGNVALFGAGTLLSKSLGEKLQQQTHRLFGLEKFSVDPFLTGGGQDPGARITLGRQISKNVAISYVSDIGTANPGQLVAVEVRLTPWITAVATREQNGSVAVDFKLKKRF